ncbi:RTA1-domain-containing protein [Artomyces pyxidatus]|uniref:RTA1-domain-containing protein n=1 Tax=Artomyces pyxidatus TaxID=48021 RepID=A0ACB8SLI5_9AGAM|nr:RTA1-domain-containing protein [Artomyces pyxidatus]
MSSNSTWDQNANLFQNSPYIYFPTEWVCATLLSLFALSTLIHVGQAIYFRIWWLFPTAVVAGILEVLGWTGRTWSSLNAKPFTPYLMQITTTIIAPTPLVAANFIILGQVITRLGPRYSRLSARWYTILFVSCDIVALVVQAIGGAAASNAVNQHKDPGPGGNIMLGGIVFQLAAIVVYVALALEFLLRYTRNQPIHDRNLVLERRRRTDIRMKLMLLGMCLMTIFIFIRSVYRTIELAGGWTGRIIQTQVLFNVLDGAMICLAMYTLNILHPGLLLQKTSLDRGDDTPVESKQAEKAEP